VALVVTPVALILGTLAAFAITRFRYRLRGGVAGLVAAPLVVPWLLVGVGALMFFNRLNVPLSLKTIGVMHVTVAFPLVAAIGAALPLRREAGGEIPQIVYKWPPTLEFLHIRRGSRLGRSILGL